MMGEMDHIEVRDLLADAAIEPGGLDRLTAGDTPTAVLVAGHLAGCPDCADELERLRRSVGIIRPTIRAVPPPELRERTLAYVAAIGRPRGQAPGATPARGADGGADASAARPSAATAGEPAAPVGAPSAAPVSIVAARRRLPQLATLAGLAAALIVAVTGTALVVDGGRQTFIRAQAAEVEALGDVARWTLRVDGQPDVRRIALVGAPSSSSAGTLVFSPSSTALVVVADRLALPPAGREYRCWVEVDGHRAAIGKMFFGGRLAYWVGNVPEVAALSTGARFGVSLVDLAAPDQPGDPVLVSAS